MSYDDSQRIRDARAKDRAELRAVVRKIVRTPQDAADWMIAEYETATGEIATDEDRAEALREAQRLARGE